MNTENTQMVNGCLTAAFWERTWQEFQRDSILKTTQQIHPDRWRQFYDQVAGLWDQISGIGPEAAEAAVQALDAQHQLAPGMTALEIGCGPGNLTMALAARGVKVTAMDDSPGMLSVLLRRIENQGMRNVEAVLSSWKKFQAEAPYQMVLAAFFPQAMTAAGIQQMETSAGQTCALVVGTGQETFPFRREIWRKIMTTPLPEINFHLPCAMAYLLTSGRNPNLQHLSWQASLCLPADEVVRYFQAYLAIFGKQGPEVRDVIMEVISPYLEDDMLNMDAKASAALIHWHPHDAKPC
jgi:protein-L-isoaspartate O-methyltransferase